MDQMTFTKVIGGFCGALLVYLLGVWAAEVLYHVTGGQGHGGDYARSGYEIEVAVVEEAAEEEEVVDFATIYASADAAKGEKVFGKCKACHKLGDGENGTGPHMYQVVGRAVDSVTGYGYSGALSAAADVWSPENLNGFLENPKKYAPGTKMGFAGLKKIEDRANVIAYLATIN
jgi:cytochrome c